MTRLLLVEDDEDLARGLRFNLEQEGYDVTVTSQGRVALETARQRRCDLVLLDLGLPDLDGTEVLRALRQDGVPVPVICLTARGMESDVVMGLGLGADDYVTKPFGLAELLARIAAVLRRAEPAAERVQLGSVLVDLDARTARGPQGTVELTPIETDLLRHFLARRGHALDRADILKALWGLDARATTRTLDNHVARLRRKIEPDPTEPRFLLTVHGIGYRLRSEVEP